MRCHRAFSFVVAVLACLSVQAQVVGPVVPQGHESLGRVAPRHARDIAGSNWSVGAETMDRDYTVYANWKDYLGPLGVQIARIQSGWAKTEKTPGVYDWAWLDEIIPDMAAQGVTPWVNLSYGNPIYTGGGGTGLGAAMPSGAALDKWDAFAAAMVNRYKATVKSWEIWNEPKLATTTNADAYGAFLIRTAEVVRAQDPTAGIIAVAQAGVSSTEMSRVLTYVRGQGKLNLIDEVSYHPYASNPDSVYSSVGSLRSTVNGFDPRITLRQGENGAPSKQGGFGALSGEPWSETTQAKWALRRMLGDLARDIPSNIFSIIDMKYDSKWNDKGLIDANEDLTVNHTKIAYSSVQNLTSIFDNTLTRIANYASTPPNNVTDLSVFGYQNAEGLQAITLWKRDTKTTGDPPTPFYHWHG